MEKIYGRMGCVFVVYSMRPWPPAMDGTWEREKGNGMSGDGKRKKLGKTAEGTVLSFRDNKSSSTLSDMSFLLLLLMLDLAEKYTGF